MRPWQWWSCSLVSLAIGVIGLLSLAGYALDVPALRNWANMTSMAINTACCMAGAGCVLLNLVFCERRSTPRKE